MVNKIILVGNVGSDPEVRAISEEVSVASLSLATSESYKNRDGERVTNTEWHNVVFWRGLAKVVEKYVKKGDKIYVEGKLTHETYEKDGETKYITKIVASDMKMLGGKKESDQAPAASPAKAAEAPAPNIDITPEDGDDLPF